MNVVVRFTEVQNLEEVTHSKAENVEAYLGENLEGKGNLVVTTKRVIFMKDNNQGFYVLFPYIESHAICKSSPDIPSPHLRCQLDSEEEPYELQFKFDNQTTLDAIYKAFSHCTLLNPDPEQEDLEDSLAEKIAFEGDVHYESNEEGSARAKKLKVFLVFFE